MPLKRKLDKLDGVDEILKAFYRKDDATGTFTLDLDGDDPLQEAGKAALVSERKARQAAETKLAAFKGLEPDAVREAVDRWEELKDLDPNKEAEKIAETKIKAREKQILAQAATELKAKDDRIANLFRNVEQNLVDQRATAALAEAKGSVELLLPIIQRRTRVKELDGGRFAVDVLDDDGNPRIKDATGASMSIGDLVAEMKASPKFARAFEGSGASGGGGGGTGGGGGGGNGSTRVITRSQIGEISLEDIASGKATVKG